VRRSWSRVALLCAALALVDGGALGAQTAPAGTPTLDEVESLMNAGRTEDARVVLTAWMAPAAPRGGSSRSGERAAARPSRADQQRALWLRALLTVDPAQAAVDFQRLVVEYPGGSFSDRALLRLAQAAEARGESMQARELLTTLLRDYPGSPIRLDAGRMLESIPSEDVLRAAAPATTSSMPTSAPATADAPAAPPAPRPAAAPEIQPSTAGTPPGSSAGAALRWTVQLGAFASVERAAGLRDELVAEGVEVRLVSVPGTRLIHVRTGRFASQPEAERVRQRLTERGLVATVAADADREEAAR
jgi:cell division protein FtsN